jgi:hypothetical protein
MSTQFQIAIDCADPHGLAEFWVEALGYEVEEGEEMIRSLLEQGVASPDDVTEHKGTLVWKTATAASDPGGTRPRLLFQQVPEAKPGKNRVHLDLFVGEEGREAEVARLEALGARRLWDGRQGPHTWVTMADPEGNEFCVCDGGANAG